MKLTKSLDRLKKFCDDNVLSFEWQCVNGQLNRFSVSIFYIDYLIAKCEDSKTSNFIVATSFGFKDKHDKTLRANPYAVDFTTFFKKKEVFSQDENGKKVKTVKKNQFNLGQFDELTCAIISARNMVIRKINLIFCKNGKRAMFINSKTVRMADRDAISHITIDHLNQFAKDVPVGKTFTINLINGNKVKAMLTEVHHKLDFSTEVDYMGRKETYPTRETDVIESASLLVADISTDSIIGIEVDKHCCFITGELNLSDSKRFMEQI